MTLYNNFKEAIKNNSALSYLVNSKSLETVFEHLEANAAHLQRLRGTVKAPTDPDAFSQWGMPILTQEKLSQREGSKPWRFVFDVPLHNGTYINDPVIQICTGEPEFYRFVMTFTANGVITKWDDSCIDANPNLSEVTHTEEGEFNGPVELDDRLITLADRKSQDEALGVQRIAVLGPARVFIHDNQATPANPEHKTLIANVEKQLDRCMSVFEQKSTAHSAGVPKPRFRLINGGWAGNAEGSTGLPFIAYLFGAMKDASVQQKDAITIMPRGGAYDRVVVPGQANYFPIEGTWGDDSKYLIGFSTSLIVFEPYGFWTGIELNNAMIQEKPIAVITKELKDADKSRGYEIVTTLLKNGQQGHYRKYQDGAKAAEWINRCWNVSFVNNLQHLDKTTKQQIGLNSTHYIDNTSVHFKDWIDSALHKIDPAQHENFKHALLQHNGTNLQFLSEEDKNNKLYAMYAIRQTPSAFAYVSPDLQNDDFLIKLKGKLKDLDRIEMVSSSQATHNRAAQSNDQPHPPLVQHEPNASATNKGPVVSASSGAALSVRNNHGVIAAMQKVLVSKRSTLEQTSKIKMDQLMAWSSIYTKEKPAMLDAFIMRASIPREGAWPTARFGNTKSMKSFTEELKKLEPKLHDSIKETVTRLQNEYDRLKGEAVPKEMISAINASKIEKKRFGAPFASKKATEQTYRLQEYYNNYIAALVSKDPQLADMAILAFDTEANLLTHGNDPSATPASTDASRLFAKDSKFIVAVTAAKERAKSEDAPGPIMVPSK